MASVTTHSSAQIPPFPVGRFSGDERTYLLHHPGPADVGVAIEIAESSLAQDRQEKGLLYAPFSGRRDRAASGARRGLSCPIER